MSDFTLQACKFVFTYKNITSSEISRCAGNFGHLTFFLKSPTKESKTIIYGFAIPSRIFGMAFDTKK